MKRFLSLLLTLTILLACVGVLVVSASAEGAVLPAEKAAVEYVGTNYTGWNPSEVFTDVTKAYNVRSNQSTGAVWVTGKFAEPTVVTEITVTVNSKYADRARAGVVYGSADGETWVRLAVMSGERSDWGQNIKMTGSVNHGAAFSYIKYEQAASLVGNYYTFGGMEVYGRAVDARQSVTYKDYAGGYYDDGGNNAMKVFELGNSAVWNSASIAGNGGEAWVMGSFAEPTVITTVRISGHSSSSQFGRMRDATVEASVDGQNWTVLGRVKETPTSRTLLISVEDNTAYSYVRLRKVSTENSLFSVAGVDVYGFSAVPAFCAYQETVPADGTQRVRFIAAIDMLGYSNVGFRISAAYTVDGTVKTVGIDKDCTLVYTSLTATDGEGTVVRVTAEELGGTYLYAVVINGVPANAGDVVFTVTPYAAQGGRTFEGSTVTITYRNGVPAESEA